MQFVGITEHVRQLELQFWQTRPLLAVATATMLGMLLQLATQMLFSKVRLLMQEVQVVLVELQVRQAALQLAH